MLIRLTWPESVLSFYKAVWELGKLIPANKRFPRERSSKSYPCMELPRDAEEDVASYLHFTEGMDARIRSKLTSLCQELR